MSILRSLLSCSLFFIFIISCDDTIQNTPSTKSRIKNTIQVDSLPSLTLPLEISEQKELLDESTLTRTKGYSFTGNIDSQYAIEMLLIPIKDTNNNCQILSGSYSYASSRPSISLDGKICFDQQKINVQHRNEKGVAEYFEGSFSTNLSTIQGIWAKAEKKQQLNFELQNIMNLRNTELFVTALSNTLDNDIEAPSAQDIGYDKKGIYIESLEGPHLEYDFFPGNFYASSSYSSTMRTSTYETRTYLKKLSIKEAYVAITHYKHDNAHFEEGKHVDVEPEINEETTYSVWMYQGDTIVNIFVSKEMKAQHPIYATLKDNTLIIIDQVSQKEQKLQQKPLTAHYQTNKH